MLAYLGAMLAHLGAMLAHLGAMWPSLGLCGHGLQPMLGHLGAMLGQRRRILGLMLSHVDPSGATRSKKEESH